MKMIKFWQSLLIATVLLPAMVFAQPFNNIYSFQTPYTNSVHTDGVQLSNGYIAEGGTIDLPNAPVAQKVVEIALVGTAIAPPNGLIVPPAFYYADPDGFDLLAVDMVEGQTRPNQVIEIADYWDQPAGFWRIVAFKVDPQTCSILWSIELGNGLPYDLHAAAIVNGQPGFHYILGHTRDAAGMMMPYLAKIDNNGVVIWENTYSDPANPNASHQSVDLLYDFSTDSVIFTTNRTLLNPFPPVRDGIVTLEVTSTTGAVATASHLPILVGTGDFDARDMDLMNNGEYAIVGSVNVLPTQAFLVRYLPGLVPAPAFSTVYVPAVPGNPIWFTGVKPFAGGMVVSLEWFNMAGVLVPGMIELAPIGTPVNPGIDYSVPPPPGGGYIASRGLISLNGATAFVVKGSINFGMPSAPSLSLFAQNAPFAGPDPSNCEGQVSLDWANDKRPNIIPFMDTPQFTDIQKSLYCEQINGEILNCQGQPIAGFKLAAPTGINELTENPDMNVYPNPTNGNITIEMSDEMTEVYQTGEIFNALGKVVKTFNINGPVMKVDLSDQTPGIYLLRLKAGNGNVSTPQRIMIK